MVKGVQTIDALSLFTRLVLCGTKNTFTEFNTFQLLPTVFSGRETTAQGKMKVEKHCLAPKLKR